MGSFPIPWDMYIVCTECSQGKKVVSVDFVMVTPDFGWLHS